MLNRVSLETHFQSPRNFQVISSFCVICGLEDPSSTCLRIYAYFYVLSANESLNFINIVGSAITEINRWTTMITNLL